MPINENHRPSLSKQFCSNSSRFSQSDSTVTMRNPAFVARIVGLSRLSASNADVPYPRGTNNALVKNWIGIGASKKEEVFDASCSDKVGNFPFKYTIVGNRNINSAAWHVGIPDNEVPNEY